MRPEGATKERVDFCNSGRSKSRFWQAVRARFFTIRFFCRAGAETRKAGLSASSWEMQGGNSCGISLVFFVVRAGCKLRLVVHLFEERIDFFAAHGEDVVGFLVDDDFVRLAQASSPVTASSFISVFFLSALNNNGRTYHHRFPSTIRGQRRNGRLPAPRRRCCSLRRAAGICSGCCTRNSLSSESTPFSRRARIRPSLH